MPVVSWLRIPALPSSIPGRIQKGEVHLSTWRSAGPAVSPSLPSAPRKEPEGLSPHQGQDRLLTALSLQDSSDGSSGPFWKMPRPSLSLYHASQGYASSWCHFLHLTRREGNIFSARQASVLTSNLRGLQPVSQERGEGHLPALQVTQASLPALQKVTRSSSEFMTRTSPAIMTGH